MATCAFSVTTRLFEVSPRVAGPQATLPASSLSEAFQTASQLPRSDQGKLTGTIDTSWLFSKMA